MEKLIFTSIIWAIGVYMILIMNKSRKFYWMSIQHLQSWKIQQLWFFLHKKNYADAIKEIGSKAVQIPIQSEEIDNFLKPNDSYLLILLTLNLMIFCLWMIFQPKISLNPMIRILLQYLREYYLTLTIISALTNFPLLKIVTKTLLLLRYLIYLVLYTSYKRDIWIIL